MSTFRCNYLCKKNVQCILIGIYTSPKPKTNMDTQKDGLAKVTPFKHDDF